MNRAQFVNGEYYHIYNRGVDKRAITMDQHDSDRFIQSLQIFNDIEPSGSIYEQKFEDYTKRSGKALVDLVCYCLNPNHFHFVLKQKVEKGISEFMRRIGCGYTYYFNNKHKRAGALFQGVFKSSHIDSNEYLLHTSSYVNLNNRVHQLGGETSKLVRSSWNEYMGKIENEICRKKIILDQFDSIKKYEKFALSALLDMIATKQDEKELKKLFHE